MPNQSRTRKGWAGKVRPVIDIAGLAIDPVVVEHPLLGPSHVIAHAGAPITAMSAIDWDRPTQIPAIAAPRALPPGAGTLLMNHIAERARDSGVPSLRYAGPYPTHALYRSLLRSFRTDGSEDAFTGDALGRSLRVDRTMIPIDFRPAPFRRRSLDTGFVDIRDDIVERAQLGAILFAPDGDTLAQLVRIDGGYEAELSVGGLRVALLARLDAIGDVVDGPHPPPSFAAGAVGSPFPDPLRIQLAELAAVLVPSPLSSDVRRILTERSIEWADLGWRAAASVNGRFVVHVAFLVLAKHDMNRFAELLSYHLARIAQGAVLDEVLTSRS
jgi:hypothetical protein